MPSPPRIFSGAVAFACATALLVARTAAQTTAQAESQRRSEAAQAYSEGMQAFNAGRWAEAAEKVARSISLITDPNEQQMLSAAYFTLGAAYFNVPNYPKTIETFKTFLQKYPASERVMDVRVALGQAYVQNKNYEEGLKLWQQLEQTPALRDKALAAQISIYQAQEKRELMVKTMEKLGGGELKTPLQARGAMVLAGHYADLDQPDDASRVLNKVLGKPELIDSLVPVNSTAIKLGDAYADKKRYPEAIRVYRWVKPRNAVLQYSKDRITMLERRKDANMRNVIGNPQLVAAASLQNKEIDGMLAEQRAMLEEFEKLPDYASALLFRQARCWYDWEKKWEAVVCYDRLLTTFPKDEYAEQAMYGIVLSYADLNQARLCQQACERYLDLFPTGTNAGTVGYLSGAVSLQNNDPATAEKFFGIMVEKQPDSPYREDMTMLLGHAKFMQGRWEDARKDYEAYLQKYGNGSNKEEVTYRLACIDVFTGKYEEALRKLDVYVTAFPKGDFVPDAKYREAVCYYAAERYEDVISKCDAWLVRFGKDPLSGEVLSLMGDAYGAQNKHEQAARAYERSATEASTDEVLVYSLFEASKQMQKAGMWEAMTKMFVTFVETNPEHQAAVAALYWIGRAKGKLGKVEEAKAFLVEQTRKYINEPKREAVESLLTQLAQLSLKRPPPPQEAPKSNPAPAAQTIVAVNGAVGQSSPQGAPEPVTAPELPPWDPFAEYDKLTASLMANAPAIARARVLFGRGELFEFKRQPEKKQEVLDQLASEFKAEDFSPILLGRVGDHLREKGDVARARELYEKLKEDFRKSEYLDYAYTGLGDIAYSEKQYEKALELYDTAIEKVGASFKMKEATVGKARTLLELGRYDDSKKLFEQIASIKEWRGDSTALAVFSLGEIEARQGRYAEAIAHFRRVFVAYQKYLPWVARSYIRAAESFDKMNKRVDAIQNLQEMLRNEKLNGLPEAAQARELLQRWQAA